MNYFNLIFILTSIAIISCRSKETSSESTKTVLQPKDQIEFIRENHALIESKIESETYSVIESVNETEIGTITYKRVVNGDKIIYAYSANCNDHGCNKSSYYFWDNKLIFKLDQNSSWVDRSDKISEKRTYYLDETEILCLQRTKTGSGGYDAVNQLLNKVPQDTLQCNSVFDRSTIKEILEFIKDEVKELAIVQKVEDGPDAGTFGITCHFIDRETTETIYVNSENNIFYDPTPSELVGKTVMVGYLNMNVTKVHRFYGDKDEVREVKPEWKILKGILKGAESETISDLPNQVTIELEDGSNMVFDYYIDRNTISLNNKTVTAYYTSEETKEVSSLKLIEKELTVDNNLIHASNDKYIVKVDRLSDNTIRYQSWGKSKKITEEPDLILTNGKIEKQGSEGCYFYFFKNKDWEYILEERPISNETDSKSVYLKLLNNGEEKVYSKLSNLKNIATHDKLQTKEVKHYICYTNNNDPSNIIWISYGTDGKAIQIKYKGMKAPIALVFDKQSENLNPGGPYPVFVNYYNEIVDDKVNGVYKLTHSGVYDYVEYIKGKNSKILNFTIDHSVNQYGATPCF
ncbi:hypothetical protein [Aquimarina pacifica]|uniref:hypothetical protein n=1 Tax=Aquimarina pacifica TaxID=1296415 RepID=UPI0004701CAC|nr:hypothetical protein [Aquimarina pacifica]